MNAVSKYGNLKVAGGKLLDRSSQLVSLHGVSLGWHNWWPRFYSKAVIKELAERWNCTVVRAAMGVDHKDGFINKPIESYELIRAVIEGCIENDIYFIVDWHTHNFHQDEASLFFYRVSKEYGKYPNVIYEIFNEPVFQSWKRIKKYAEHLVNVIRGNGDNNIILVGCPHWDQDIHIVADDLLIGYDNLMYTFHFYAGSHKQELRSRLESVLEKKLPVFISECGGMNADGNGRIDSAEWLKWVELLDKEIVSWVAWSVVDKNETCSMLKPEASSFGVWSDNDIKEWGIAIKKLLRSYILT